MKKILLNAATACLSLFTYNLSIAQSNTDMAYHSRVIPARSADAKGKPTPKFKTGNTVFVTKNEIGMKVARRFLQTFKNVTSVDWFEVNSTFYLAHFDLDGKKSRALFQKDGGIVYTITTGPESSLPKEIRRQIKSEYIDYSIGTVNEVSTNRQKEWVVNLEDAENLIVVSIVNGDLQELNHFKTSDKK